MNPLDASENKAQRVSRWKANPQEIIVFDNDHTDAEYARREYDSEIGNVTHESREDAKWFRWCAAVEGLLGIAALDGDQETDGYSLDFALDHYEDKKNPEQYAETVRRAWDSRAEPQ